MLVQLAIARPDARVRLSHAGAEIGVHRDRVVVHAPPPPMYEQRWNGETALTLPHGCLSFAATRSGGLDPQRLREGSFVVRPRRGGERLALEAGRPRRALKSFLRESDVATWERAALPLLFWGDDLAAVPGLGVDVAFRATPGHAGVALVWTPADSAGGERSGGCRSRPLRLGFPGKRGGQQAAIRTPTTLEDSMKFRWFTPALVALALAASCRSATADRDQVQPRRRRRHAEGQGRRVFKKLAEERTRRSRSRCLPEQPAVQGRRGDGSAAARLGADARAVGVEVRAAWRARVRGLRPAVHVRQLRRAAQGD
jgi:tRNA(Ile)-lysidine synthetase-like protein